MTSSYRGRQRSRAMNNESAEEQFRILFLSLAFCAPSYGQIKSTSSTKSRGKIHLERVVICRLFVHVMF